MQNDKPLFDKYNFDEDNRKKLPKDIKIPPILAFENEFVKEAKDYCKKFKSVGVCEYFYYPTTFEEASLQLNYFLKEKFENFGFYQDAITKDTKRVFGCPLLLKVEPPTLAEIEMINPETTIISAIQLKTKKN